MYRLCEVSFPAQPSQVKATLVFPQGPVYSLFKLPQTPPAAAPTSPPSLSLPVAPASEHGLAAGKQLCVEKVLPSPRNTRDCVTAKPSQPKEPPLPVPGSCPCPTSSQTSRSSRRLHTPPTCCLSCPQPPAKHRPPSGQGNGIIIVMQQKRKP